MITAPRQRESGRLRIVIGSGFSNYRGRADQRAGVAACLTLVREERRWRFAKLGAAIFTPSTGFSSAGQLEKRYAGRSVLSFDSGRHQALLLVFQLEHGQRSHGVRGERDGNRAAASIHGAGKLRASLFPSPVN